MNRMNFALVSLAALLIGIAGIVTQAPASTVGATYTATVNATGDLGTLDHFWSRACGDGDVTLQLRPEMRTHMQMAHSEWGMMGTSGHGIFNDYLKVYTEDANGNPVYSWTLLDSAYDYEVNTLGMRPSIELFAMPKALCVTTGKTIFVYDGVPNYVSVPKDYTKWKNLCAAVAQHFETRYGAAAVRQFSWRVWNENNPGGFSFGDINAYDSVYDYAVMGVKSVDTLIKIGGPSYAGGGSQSDMMTFLTHCRTQNFADGTKSSTPIDFVSYTIYASSGTETGFPGDWACVARVNETFAGYLSAAGFPVGAVKTLNTEYGPGGPSIPKEDGPVKGAFRGVTVGDILYDWANKGFGVNNQAVMPFATIPWNFSDMFQEDGDNSSRDFIGTYGMISYKHSIKKPSWNAMKMLNMLGDHLLSMTHSAPGDTCKGIAAKNSTTGAVQVFLYSLMVGNVNILVDHPIKVTVNNMTATAGSVRREVYLVDSLHCNSFQIWTNMGRPNPMTQAQADSCTHNQELQRVRVDTMQISGGTVTDSVYLMGNGVGMVVFTPLPIITVSTSPRVMPVQQSAAAHAQRLLVSRGSITIPSSMLAGHSLIKVYDLHGRQIAIVKAGKDGKIAQNIRVTTNAGWVIARPEF